MKKFVFKLQPLLDLREAKEQQIRNELSAVVSKQNAERMRQEELRAKIREQGNSIRQHWKDGSPDPAGAMQFGNYQMQALRAIDAAEQKIQELEPEAEKIRKRLLQASMEKKLVEKLKERKLEEYRHEVIRKQRTESDDINQKLYNRGKNYGG